MAVVAVAVVAVAAAVLIFLILTRGHHISYGDVPTWLTFAVAVAGIVGVALQLQMLRKSTKVQVYEGLIQNSSKIDEILIERPELRKYIYDGAAVPRSKLRQAEVESLIELALDMLDNLKVQSKYIPKENLQGWRNYENNLLRQPTVEKYLRDHGAWYSGLAKEI